MHSTTIAIPAAGPVRVADLRFVPRAKPEREAFAYLRRQPPHILRTQADQLAAQLLPRARHGQRAAAAQLLYALLRSPKGIQLGRDQLAREAGVCLRTATSALNALRGVLVWRPWHGRKGRGCGIYVPTGQLLLAAAALVRSAAATRSAQAYASLKRLRQNTFHGAKAVTKDTHLSVSSAVVGAGGAGECAHGVDSGRLTRDGQPSCPICRRMSAPQVTLRR